LRESAGFLLTGAGTRASMRGDGCAGGVVVRCVRGRGDVLLARVSDTVTR